LINKFISLADEVIEDKNKDIFKPIIEIYGYINSEIELIEKREIKKERVLISEAIKVL
jgi:hypothetical protein